MNDFFDPDFDWDSVTNYWETKQAESQRKMDEAMANIAAMDAKMQASWDEIPTFSLEDLIQQKRDESAENVKQIYADFGIDAPDAADVEHFVDSDLDDYGIADAIGAEFMPGGKHHDFGMEKLQGLFDAQFGYDMEGKSNNPVSEEGLYWFGEGGLTSDVSGHGNVRGSWDTVAADIALHDNPWTDYGKLEEPEPLPDVIEDEQIPEITDDTTEEINNILEPITTTNPDDVVADTFDALDEYTGGVDLVADDGSNLAAGTLDQVNNDAVRALDQTLDGATESIKSLDTTGVLDDIQRVDGDLEQLQGEYSTLGTSTGNTGAENLAAIQATIAAEGYDDQISNLDTTFNNRISSLTDQLFDLTSNVANTQLDVTNLSGNFQSKLDALKSDLTGQTSSQFNTLQSNYDSAVDKISSLETSLNNASASTAEKFANQKELFDAKLAANIATQQNNFTNLSTDVNSKLTDFSEDQKAKFDNVYKTRDQAIGDLQTNWGKRLQEQESGLQNRIQSTAENINNRLTNISKNMNYRMLGDSAAGIKMRRSKAFTSGRTAKGTGQMNRAMRIQTLNL